ncbi:DUF4912 domain-containing protein [Peribacillus deserti]|uniref:DUF4912 domain-containing protein n=1 Tax=Peribacillus deserti TaxID=673318 RepID=A0A2N5M4B3_9BACI|nr:DUF4912 domain-containing protein [Peribacillus deserti]PLT29200.1 hypothetical protein CUU66_14745 [Peribacillus deserti]
MEKNIIHPGNKDHYISAVLQNENIIVLHWSVSDYKKQIIAFSMGVQPLQLKKQCRIYDVTGISFTGNNARMYMDVPLPDQAGTWKLSGVKPNRSYIIDIGYKGNSTLIPILRSKVIHTPGAGVISEDFTLDTGSWKRGQKEECGWIEQVSTYTQYETNE